MNRILLLISLALVGCATETPVSTVTDPVQRHEVDQVCLAVGSTKQLVVLQEDVEWGQLGARAKRPDGSVGIIDTDYIMELSSCIGGSND